MSVGWYLVLLLLIVGSGDLVVVVIGIVAVGAGVWWSCIAVIFVVLSYLYDYSCSCPCFCFIDVLAFVDLPIPAKVFASDFSSFASADVVAIDFPWLFYIVFFSYVSLPFAVFIYRDARVVVWCSCVFLPAFLLSFFGICLQYLLLI